MKIFKWKSSRMTDFNDFFCAIHFEFGGTEKEYLQLVDHYNHLATMYHLEIAMFHKWVSQETEIYSYLRVYFRKNQQTRHVPPNLLKCVLETDSKILLRTFRLAEVEFYENHSELDQD